MINKTNSKVKKKSVKLINNKREIYKKIAELNKDIKNIKKGHDWWAPASALLMENEIKSIINKAKQSKLNKSELNKIQIPIKKFEELKAKPIYKKMIDKSINNFRRMIKRDKIAIKKYGYKSRYSYVDKDYLNLNKKYLKFVEKENNKL